MELEQDIILPSSSTMIMVVFWLAPGLTPASSPAGVTICSRIVSGPSPILSGSIVSGTGWLSSSPSNDRVKSNACAAEKSSPTNAS